MIRQQSFGERRFWTETPPRQSHQIDFDASAHNRIRIIDCMAQPNQHLQERRRCQFAPPSESRHHQIHPRVLPRIASSSKRFANQIGTNDNRLHTTGSCNWPIPDSVMLACRSRSSHPDSSLSETQAAISCIANQPLEPAISSKPAKIPDLHVPLMPIKRSKASPQALLLLFLFSFFFFSPRAYASTHAEGALSFGQKVASFLRSSGIPDEATIFLIASLPVVELRGAVPVAYWLQMEPMKASVLAILGNMLPVPLLLLSLGHVSAFLATRSQTLKRALDWLLETTHKKSGPIKEFKWLGLMLFVAVPLPGTGAWSGAICAYILGMPFWNAVSANFVGVILACCIVNMMCRIGLKYAAILGVILFLVSTFVWSFLRWVSKGFAKGEESVV